MEQITVSSPLTTTATLGSALCVSLTAASVPVTSATLVSPLNKVLTASSRIDLEES